MYKEVQHHVVRGVASIEAEEALASSVFSELIYNYE